MFFDFSSQLPFLFTTISFIVSLHLFSCCHFALAGKKWILQSRNEKNIFFFSFFVHLRPTLAVHELQWQRTWTTMATMQNEWKRNKRTKKKERKEHVKNYGDGVVSMFQRKFYDKIMFNDIQVTMSKVFPNNSKTFYVSAFSFF